VSPSPPLRALALALAAGCSFPSGPQGAPPSVRIEVDPLVVDRGPDGAAVVAFRVTNAGTDTLFVARCGARLTVTVARLEAVGWVQRESGVCIATLPMSPIALPPGASLPGDRTVTAPGRYRLGLGLARSSSDAPDWTATSEAFDVR
jgi:hypothetical protein